MPGKESRVRWWTRTGGETWRYETATGRGCFSLAARKALASRVIRFPSGNALILRLPAGATRHG
jgi:hypothetical protein